MKDICSSISKLLDKYFDSEASQRERSLVEKHLLECSTCRRKLKLMEGIREAIQSPVAEALEKETFPWIWEKIEREIKVKPKESFWEVVKERLEIILHLKKKIWVPVAVVTAILLILYPLFKKNSSHFVPPVVEYVKSETHNVMIYELENVKVTVIWLFEESEMDPST